MKRELANSLTKQIDSSFFKDLYLSSRAISWSCGISFLWCLIFLYLMSFFAETISWFIVILVQIGLFTASGLTLFQYNEIKSKEELTDDDQEAMRLLLIIGLSTGILGVLYFICVCCFYQSLKIAIDVIDASADFLAKTKRIIIVPVIYFVVNVVSVLVWIAAFISVTTLKFDSVIPQSGAVIH